MIAYNVVRSNTTPTSAQDFFTLLGAATRSYGVLEIDIEGGGTASAYTEIALYRQLAVGVTGGGAITAVPVNPASPASGFTAETTWVTQPTKGALIHTCPVNSNGQRYFWRAMPNLSNAIWSPGGAVFGGAMSLLPVTISGAITARLQVGEI